MADWQSIRQASLDELFRWWDGLEPLPDGLEEDDLAEVAEALTKRGEPGIAKLKQALPATDPQRRQWAISSLARPGVADAQVEAALVQAFQSSDEDLKAVALWGFIDLGFFPVGRREMAELLEQEDQRLAAQAMVYLSRAYPRARVSILRAALQSANPRMREYACDEIGDLDIQELVNEMRLLVQDPDSEVAQAARSNLWPDSGAGSAPPG